MTKYGQRWIIVVAVLPDVPMNNEIGAGTAVVRKTTLRLSKFIDANMERLLTEWQAFADTCSPAANDLDKSGLRDAAEAILRAVVREMDHPRTAHDRRKKSRGGLSGTSPELTEPAQRHATERLAAGFTLDQLVAEYRALRSDVTARWLTSSKSSDAETSDDLARFNEAMDQSLTEAIKWFNGRLERSRDIFVGVLGHDLRNPLNTIISTAEVAKISDDLELMRECTSRISRSAERMSEMIAVLLDFSRTRLGEQIPLSLGRCNLADVCQAVAQDFEHSHPDRILLKCARRITGRWDEHRLHQALSNLVKNALEYGKRRNIVTLRCEAKADEVVVSVHNEGRAIPLAKQRNIFEPFKRTPPEDDGEDFNGHVGLGLYVVNQITVAHGGSIEIASDRRNGTTFTLHLPRTGVRQKN
ncbi:MAG: HAMP domain-containing sensor histidine kinase [Woeseia sp.]